MNRYFFLLYALIFASCAQKQSMQPDITQEQMEQGFVNPPQSAKPHTWWHWMNGNITREGITADLEAMAEAGLGGAQIFNVREGIPQGPVQFAGPEWFDLVRFAAEEASRLGLEICIHNCAGWANSGGPWNTPENSMKTVVTSEITVAGPTRLTEVPPQPKSNLNFYQDIAILAFPATPKDSIWMIDNRLTDASHSGESGVSVKPLIENFNGKIFRQRGNTSYAAPEKLPDAAVIDRQQIVDLTGLLLDPKGQNTGWDAPEGEWTILRIGYTGNGRKNHPAPEEGTGLEVDKLSREAIKAHWDSHTAKIIAAIGKQNINGQTGLNNVLIDSYEVGTQNWTKGFETEFQRRTGYSIIPYLPTLSGRVTGSAEETERFLQDFRRVITDMFAENYSGYFGKLAHEAGLLYSCEPYGDCPSNDIQYGSYCDIPMGEFWQNSGPTVDMGNSKLPASIAHVYGKKFVGAEAFTAGPSGGKWLKDAFGLKAQNDAALCAGINRMIYHRYAHQPWTAPDRAPGMTMGQWGTHFERTITWWKQAKDWLRYQSRCQFLLQEGRFVADVLFYCGEGAPNDLRPARLPRGYDYDGCDARALKLLKVVNGRIVAPSGTTYRLLVLPDDPAMSPEILKIISRIVNDGATVLAQSKPTQSYGLAGYPESDTKTQQAVEQLWPKLITDKTPADAIKEITKPDFVADETEDLKYIHRNIADADVYFVACPSLKGAEVNCSFRVSGKTPELWHPETGEIEIAPVFSETDGITTLPLRFDPCGSVFVVFRHQSPANHAVTANFTPVAEKQTVTDNLKILKAEYGFFADEGFDRLADVTATVKKILESGKHVISVSNSNFNDPAFGFIKKIRIDYTVDGIGKSVEAGENQTLTLPTGTKVIRAYYGVLENLPEAEPVRGVADITATLAQLCTDGRLTTKVDFALNHGIDPAPNLPKQLRVEYSFNGQRDFVTVKDNKMLVLPPEPEDQISLPDYELRITPDGNLQALIWKNGKLDIQFTENSNIESQQITIEQPFLIDGKWDLNFPPNLGAPEKVVLDRLISWTEHPDPGVKYFSGTAVYSKKFVFDDAMQADTRIILDFGKLKNFAEVTLNGQHFPLLWKPPYRIDVTDAIKNGENELQVAITNLWPNRLIGDEQMADDCEWNGIQLKEWPAWLLAGQPSPTDRIGFTTWRHWRKFDQPLPSGLLEQVVLRKPRIVNGFSSNAQSTGNDRH